MKDGKLGIRFMMIYKKIGRILYLIIFLAILIETVLSGFRKEHDFFPLILLDSIVALTGLLIESTLINYSQKGTIYIETTKHTTKHKLKNLGSTTRNFYILETGFEYSFQINDETYRRHYRKDEVELQQDSSLDNPFAEITIIETISQAAKNKYSSFAIVGDKNKKEKVKLIIRNTNQDISISNIDS